MSATDFVAIGDLHFESLDRLFTNYDFNSNDMIFKALDMPLDYAKENSVNNIIILGDIFDSPHPSSFLQKKLLQYLIKHNDFKFYIIAGNHDFQNVESVSLQMSEFISSISDQLSHVKFYTTPKLEYIDGVPFSFLPWPYCKTLQDPSVNIAHVEITGSKMDNGKIVEKGYKLKIGEGVCYCGHLHRKQEYPSKHTYYCGMLFQKTFGEPRKPKGFYHVSAKYKNNKLTYEHDYHEVVPPFELINLKIEDPADFKLIKMPDPRKIRQYRLMIKNGIELPIGIRENYPNIVDIVGKLSSKELISMEKGDYKTDIVDVSFDLFDGLDEFLINEGLSSKQLKIANKIVACYTGG